MRLAGFRRSELFAFKTNLYKLREEREISPRAFAHLVSSTQYGKRWGPYFVEPIVAGLGKDNEPFICSMDVIGCINWAKDFVVSGTAAPQLFGICEALYEPDLEPEQLFECLSQCLLNAVDRNALSGWGALVHVMYTGGEWTWRDTDHLLVVLPPVLSLVP